MVLCENAAGLLFSGDVRARLPRCVLQQVVSFLSRDPRAGGQPGDVWLQSPSPTCRRPGPVLCVRLPRHPCQACGFPRASVCSFGGTAGFGFGRQPRKGTSVVSAVTERRFPRRLPPGRTLSAACVPTACQGGSERPCSGNGHCRGDGSREGDGSCQCHAGYRGALCTDCTDGYFSSLRNATHSVCTGARPGRSPLQPPWAGKPSANGLEGPGDGFSSVAGARFPGAFGLFSVFICTRCAEGKFLISETASTSRSRQGWDSRADGPPTSAFQPVTSRAARARARPAGTAASAKWAGRRRTAPAWVRPCRPRSAPAGTVVAVPGTSDGPPRGSLDSHMGAPAEAPSHPLRPVLGLGQWPLHRPRCPQWPPVGSGSLRERLGASKWAEQVGGGGRWPLASGDSNGTGPGQEVLLVCSHRWGN